MALLVTNANRSLFHALMSALCSRHLQLGSKAIIVQIGANDGRINDPIYEHIRRFSSATRVLLIEPQDDVIPHLKDNYSFHKDATIWNGAIGSEDFLSLYRLKTDYYQRFIRRYLEDSPAYRVPTGFTSANYNHVMQHIAGNLPEGVDPVDAIEAIVRPCATLKSALGAAGWLHENIDILQIDTESKDDETMYACNLDILRPIIINFEYRFIPQDRLIRLNKWLQSLGYSVIRHNGSDALAYHKERLSSQGIDFTFSAKPVS